jgi:serine/threonine protein kinase
MEEGVRKQFLIECGVQCAQFLHMFHERGVIHGDIRPENIVINDEGSPVLIDYGLSSKLEDVVGSGPRGSIQFADPSLLQGGPASLATDLTSLFLTLHALEFGLAKWYAQEEQACSKMANKLPAGGAAASVRALVSKSSGEAFGYRHLLLFAASVGVAVLCGLVMHSRKAV